MQSPSIIYFFPHFEIPIQFRMQNLILFVLLSTFLLGLSHGFQWGFGEEELKGLEEDQIMLKQVRNVRNVEMETTNEGSGEETSDPAMRRRREVNNKDGSSSSEEEAVEGSGEAEPVKVNLMELPSFIRKEIVHKSRRKRMAGVEEKETVEGSGEQESG